MPRRFAPKLFASLGFSNWYDEYQRQKYSRAVELAMSAVVLTGFDFKNPWHDQENRSKAVEAFRGSLAKYSDVLKQYLMRSSYPITKEECEAYLRFRCRNKVKYENSKRKTCHSTKQSRKRRNINPWPVPTFSPKSHSCDIDVPESCNEAESKREPKACQNGESMRPLDFHREIQ